MLIDCQTRLAAEGVDDFRKHYQLRTVSIFPGKTSGSGNCKGHARLVLAQDLYDGPT